MGYLQPYLVKKLKDNKFILGVIPARGGSKRLPRKNILKLGKKSLIQYTIEAAQKSKLLDDFVFSTEDNEIRSIAENIMGSKILYKRPLSLADDKTRNSETLIHAVNWFEKKFSKKVYAVMLLQPTTPFRTYIQIDEAIKKFFNFNKNVLASVSGPYKKRDVRIKKIDKSGNLVNYKNKDKNEGYYQLNASIYIVKKNYLMNKKKFVSESMIPYVMDSVSSIDIDNELDFNLSKVVVKTLKARKNEKI